MIQHARILVSVDCGVRGCGVAVFDGRTLKKATYVKNPMLRGHGANSAIAMARAVQHYVDVDPAPDILAIETMSFYSAADQKGDQGDIGAVQLVAGAITGLMDANETVSYLPRDWKGTIDGDVCTNRILERLSVSEKAAIARVSESVDHNTIDGVGVGLKLLGRFEPTRVFARE